MKNIMNLNKITAKGSVFGGIVLATLLVTILGAQNVYANITTQLDIGSTGSDVTELQTYLATSAAIYPSALVTGYFGPLTQAAVKRFQASQGIVSSGSPATTGYGRVGPTTMARINSLRVAGGGVVQTNWDTVPILSSLNVDSGKTEVKFTWNTNENTQGQIYLDDSSLSFGEATGPRQLPYVSGDLHLESGGIQTNHSVTISDLKSNTRYYYMVRGVDSVGNMSVIWPSSFMTD